MVMVVVGAFPTRFFSPIVRTVTCLKTKPTYLYIFSTTTRNRILSSTAKKNKHCIVACSNNTESDTDVEIEIGMEKVGNNMRRIEARVGIEAPLQAVWDVLTDYEALSDFIPGLSKSQLLQQSPNFARLFQVGEQKLGLGLKFNAKGVVDCFERDLQMLASGAVSRDIDFQMVQGDFEVFEGKWSILQEETSMSSVLSYSLQVKPKLWLPVRLVEARLCNEIKVNLASIRQQALFIISVLR